MPGKNKIVFILLTAAFIGCAAGAEYVCAQPLPSQAEEMTPASGQSVRECAGREAAANGVIDLKNSIIEGMAGQDLEMTGISRPDFFMGQAPFGASGTIAFESAKNAVTPGSLAGSTMSAADVKAPAMTFCPALSANPALDTVTFSRDALDIPLAEKLDLLPLPTREEMHNANPWLFIPQPVFIGADSVAKCGPLFRGLSDRQRKISRMIFRYESEHAIPEGDKIYCAALLASDLSGSGENAALHREDGAEDPASIYAFHSAGDAAPSPHGEDGSARNSVWNEEAPAPADEAPDGDPAMVRGPDLNDGATEDYIIFMRGIVREWDGAKKTFYDQMQEIAEEDPGAVAIKDGSVVEAVILLEPLVPKDDAKDKGGEGEEEKP